MRAVNRLPALRLDVTTPTRGAVSWVSDALREMAPRPETSIPALERTIYYGIDQPSEIRRNPPDEPTIAYVGRVTPSKGADIAVDAVAKLEREHGCGPACSCWVLLMTRATCNGSARWRAGSVSPSASRSVGACPGTRYGARSRECTPS